MSLLGSRDFPLLSGLPVDRRLYTGVRTGSLVQTFGMADEEMALRNSRIIETLYKRILCILVEIDHHVPAEDQVELAFELDLVHQVEGLEDHVLFDRRGHGVPAAACGDEILLFPGGRESGYALVAVGSRDRGVQDFLGDVRGQDPGIPLGGLSPEKLLQIHGDRVGLLAGGAACAPDGQALIPGVLFLQIRQDHIPEILKMGFLTEEVGVVGGQLVQHGGDHLFITAGKDLIHIGGKIPVALGGQRIGKAADDQLLFLAQVDPVIFFDIGIKTVKVLISQWQHCGSPRFHVTVHSRRSTGPQASGPWL